MKKTLALVLAVVLMLGCVSFAAAEGTGPDTYSMIANFEPSPPCHSCAPYFGAAPANSRAAHMIKCR